MTTPLHRILAQPSRATAIESRSGSATFGELASASSRLARALGEGHGITRGERVGLLLEPGPAFVEALFAVWRARAVALVLTTLHPAKERARLLADAGARLVITSPQLAEDAADAHDLRVHVHARSGEGLGPGQDGSRSSAPAEPSSLLPEPADLALLVYTSGTTSRPKGVMLHHHHLEAQCAAIANTWRLAPDDVLVHALPLHHVHGLVIALLSVLRAGGRALMLERFEANAVLWACERANLFMGVPTMYARLLEALDELSSDEWAAAAAVLARLRLCVSGSAGLPVSLSERWRELTGSYPVERFGMTELGVALSNRVDGARLPGNVGRPLPGVDVKLARDEDGAHREDAGANGSDDGEEGEMLIAGPTVFGAYWERPAETAEAFVDDGERRWFRTGDTVRRHADGSYSVLGRTSVDILKSAGYKISALAVEEALRLHEDVRDAAVVGLPDETYGQLVAAAVTLREGRRVDPDALLEFLREEIAPYQVPRLLRVVDELPRNAMGKVVKPTLVRLLRV